MKIDTMTTMARLVYDLVGYQTPEETWFASARLNDAYVQSLDEIVANRVARGGMSQNEAGTMYLQEDYFHCAWAHFGFNVFDLTHSLTAALLLTEPSTPPDGEFRLPFDAMVLRVPEGFISIRSGATSAWARHLKVFRYVLNDEAHVAVWVMSGDEGNQPTYFTFQSPVSTFFKCGPRENLESVSGDRREFMEENTTTLDLARRLCVNVASWLMATGQQERQSSPKGKKGDRDSQNRPVFWLIGKDVKISRDLLSAAKDLALAAGGTPRAEWKVKFRHVVRGHMRNQACGPSHSERKTIWIQPHWRGPEDAAAWAHAYQAGGQ